MAPVILAARPMLLILWNMKLARLPALLLGEATVGVTCVGTGVGACFLRSQGGVSHDLLGLALLTGV